MDSRGRKRARDAGLLPTDKCDCSSSEFRPSSPLPYPPPPPPPPPSAEDEYMHSDDFDDDEDDDGSVEEEEYEYKYNVPEGGNEDNIERDIRTRIDSVLAGLASDETDVVIAALSEFLDILRVLESERIYIVYMFTHTVPKLDSIVQALVDAVGGDGSAELLLESARAVFHLCKGISGSVPVLQRHGGLPVLCRRLLTPEHLVVGEQCVKVLEKVSQSEPVPCLEAGAVFACFTYDKTAISTVANVCKKLSPSHAPHVVDAVPILSGILQYDNDKWKALPEKLDQILSVDLISHRVDLIVSKCWKSLGRTFTNDILTVLSLFASHSPEVVKTLLGLNIGATLSDVLTSQIEWNRCRSFIAYK